MASCECRGRPKNYFVECEKLTVLNSLSLNDIQEQKRLRAQQVSIKKRIILSFENPMLHVMIYDALPRMPVGRSRF